MAKIDAITGKKRSTGNSKKHQRGSSGGGGVWRYKATKTKRAWEPNFRKVKLEKDGVVDTYTVSMKSYKKLRTEGTFKGFSLVKHY